MNPLVEILDGMGAVHPAVFVGLFLAASLLMLWRLEAMMENGLKGTAVGTLVMPYCSGLGNLVFVYLVLRDGTKGQELLTNCLVNNATNLTLLLGLPAVIWGLSVVQKKPDRPQKKAKASAGKAVIEQRVGQLSLGLSMIAGLFFLGAIWALGEDGWLDFGDGAVLIGLFVFWQLFQVYDVMKQNVQQRTTLGAMIYVDVLILIGGAWVLYTSLDWLMAWLTQAKIGFFSAANLGWLSGWLMVLPNALLAFYYAAKKRADVVYASQVGDGHICIPLCLGIYAMVKPLQIGALFETGAWIIGGALVLHLLFVGVLGRLPRAAGWLLLAGYGAFLYAGLGG